MEFSSLVIMEKDKETGFLTRELGSYEVNEGAEYVKKLYESQGKVALVFDTKRDVEEWEFSAIYDLFPYEIFKDKGIDIEDIDDEYNPTWKITLDYKEEHNPMKEDLNQICYLIEEAILESFKRIEGKEAEYVE
ncbi:DUF6762 family protein [Clostridium sp.]|uniref:DUF6762 family protein n=1 Tax=Clostridium sp. TaxID=1506 RepID=UPI0034644B9D